MAEKKVSVRLSAVGGRQVRAELEGVGDAGAAFQLVSVDLFLQLCYARCAAGTFEPIRIHGYAARVIAPIFQPLKALHQNRNDIAAGNRCNNATHNFDP